MTARASIGLRRLAVCAAAADRLLETARAEVLRGFAGDDLLVGRRGRDLSTGAPSIAPSSRPSRPDRRMAPDLMRRAAAEQR